MDAPWIRLYVRAGTAPPIIVPSPIGRDWYSREMYHCVPLCIAGQLGWTVLNAGAFDVTWDGSDGPEGVTGDSEGGHVASHFGHGLLTVNPGFYVRTPPGIDLLVKAVPNLPKDGVSWLEGLIETDWFEGSFLVSARLTRPGQTVRWERDEPLFQILPYPRGWLEQFTTEVVTDGDDHAAFFAVADEWERARHVLAERLARGEVPVPSFDARYRRGVRQDATPAPASHRTSLAVPPFPGAPPAPRKL